MIMMVMVKKSFKVFVSGQWTNIKNKKKELSIGGNGKKRRKRFVNGDGEIIIIIKCI
jgi:hypothetical protein